MSKAFWRLPETEAWANFIRVEGRDNLMILTCPSCGTRYQTDRARFTEPGGNVRCAKCGHVWFHALTDVEHEAESEPELEAPPVAEDSPAFRAGAFAPDPVEKAYVPPAAAASEAARARPLGARLATAAGWLGLALFVAILAWAVVTYRQTIAELWPRTSSFYAAIGMPVNVRGLAFQDVAYTQESEEGQVVLSITGKVVNVTARELAVPEVHVTLSDIDKHELYHWNFDVGVSALKPGETKDFVTRLNSPPEAARSVDIRFVQRDETQAADR
jgi:predicted Zn finger-like uncharacterized protein